MKHHRGHVGSSAVQEFSTKKHANKYVRAFKCSEYWEQYLLSVSLCSQYTNLWSVSNSPLTPVSQNGSNSPQFLRGYSSQYPGLSHSMTVPSCGSPMYDSNVSSEAHDAAQFDASPHEGLPSVWTPATPPSLWWRHCYKSDQSSCEML